MNAGASASEPMAVLIMPMPTNSMPKPSITEPMCLTTGFLMNSAATAPANRISGAKAVRLKAVICAVTVVPMFAPMMTPMACPRSISPESTKPITIMSVAEELWISIVTTMPMITAITRLPVTFSSIVLSLSPAACLRPVDITVMPYKNSPTPPSIDSASQSVINPTPYIIPSY